MLQREGGHRHTHEQEEKSEAGVESRHLQSKWIPGVAHLSGSFCRIGDIGAIGVEPGDESRTEGTPEGTCKEDMGVSDLREQLGPVMTREGDVPKVPKTTKGKVLPTIHSPIEPRIMRMPPKKK